MEVERSCAEIGDRVQGFGIILTEIKEDIDYLRPDDPSLFSLYVLRQKTS